MSTPMPAAITGSAITTALIGTGNVRAILATSAFTPNFTDTDWTTVTGECSGGAYTRADVAVTGIDETPDELGTPHVRVAADPVSIDRPADTPAYVLLEKADHTPLAWMPIVDDAADPIVVTFDAGVAIDVRFEADKAGLRLAELDDVDSTSAADGDTLTFDAATGTWVAAPVTVASEDWHVIADVDLANSWVWSGSGSGFAPPRYRKVGDLVYVEGAITGGTPPSTALTLPAGYRPDKNVPLVTGATDGALFGLAGLFITTGGGLLVTSALAMDPGAAGGTNPLTVPSPVTVFLSGSFRAA